MTFVSSYYHSLRSAIASTSQSHSWIFSARFVTFAALSRFWSVDQPTLSCHSAIVFGSSEPPLSIPWLSAQFGSFVCLCQVAVSEASVLCPPRCCCHVETPDLVIILLSQARALLPLQQDLLDAPQPSSHFFFLR